MLSKANTTTDRLFARVLRDVLAGESFETLADLVDAVKYRLARYRLRWSNDEIAAALRLVGSNHPLVLEAKREPTPPEPQLLNQAETVAILRRIRAELEIQPKVKRMPKAILLTAGQADQLKALKMVLQEIEATTARCDALERDA